VRDANRDAYAMEVGGTSIVFDGEIDQWIFSAAPVEAKAGLKQFEYALSSDVIGVVKRGDRGGFFRRARL